MTKISELTPVFVEFIPEVKEEGFLYVSKEFELAIHLCPCGCKDQAVTSIDEGGWDYKEDGDLVTLSPSILNRGRCRSHYYLRENKIVWC